MCVSIQYKYKSGTRYVCRADPVGIIANCSFWLIAMSAYCLRVAGVCVCVCVCVCVWA